MSEVGDFKYDVAISFIASDEGLAQSIADALRETCTVFICSERQSELAGKDGLEAFTSVFRNEARVCVVLHRDEWGSTPWTRVEETAIKDRAFDEGWEFLTVVALAKAGPKWLPKTKLWLGLERFGLPGAVAVIEARVREQGGDTHPETARGRAERLGKIAAAKSQRTAFLNSKEGVALANVEWGALQDYLRGECEAMRSLQPPVDVVFDGRQGDQVRGVTANKAAVTFGWRVQYSNSLDGASLFIREFDSLYRVGMHRAESIQPIGEQTWHFTTTLDGAPAWCHVKTPDTMMTSQALAEHFLKRMLDRAHADKKRNSW